MLNQPLLSLFGRELDVFLDEALVLMNGRLPLLAVLGASDFAKLTTLGLVSGDCFDDFFFLVLLLTGLGEDIDGSATVW
jgi:hypothetical protein